MLTTILKGVNLLQEAEISCKDFTFVSTGMKAMDGEVSEASK